jgi:hypothetical protein
VAIGYAAGACGFEALLAAARVFKLVLFCLLWPCQTLLGNYSQFGVDLLTSNRPIVEALGRCSRHVRAFAWPCGHHGRCCTVTAPACQCLPDPAKGWAFGSQWQRPLHSSRSWVGSRLPG